LKRGSVGTRTLFRERKIHFLGTNLFLEAEIGHGPRDFKKAKLGRDARQDKLNASTYFVFRGIGNMKDGKIAPLLRTRGS